MYRMSRCTVPLNPSIVSINGASERERWSAETWSSGTVQRQLLETVAMGRVWDKVWRARGWYRAAAARCCRGNELL